MPENKAMMEAMQPCTVHSELSRIKYYVAIQTRFSGCTCCQETEPVYVPVLIKPAQTGFAFAYEDTY